VKNEKCFNDSGTLFFERVFRHFGQTIGREQELSVAIPFVGVWRDETGIGLCHGNGFG
jgi:hypothetical protein